MPIIHAALHAHYPRISSTLIKKVEFVASKMLMHIICYKYGYVHSKFVRSVVSYIFSAIARCSITFIKLSLHSDSGTTENMFHIVQGL